MMDHSDSDEPRVEEATVGVKANVRTLQLLIISGKAAQERRKAVVDAELMRKLAETGEKTGKK